MKLASSLITVIESHRAVPSVPVSDFVSRQSPSGSPIRRATVWNIWGGKFARVGNIHLSESPGESRPRCFASHPDWSFPDGQDKRRRCGGADWAGRARHRADRRPRCGSVDLPFLVRRHSGGNLNLGCDEGTAVSDDYTAPFKFQGKLGEVVVEMPERSPTEARQAARTDVFADLARQ